METIKTLRDIYNFPGFRARAKLKPDPKDPDGRIVRLERRQKKRFALDAVGQYQVFETDELTWSETWMPGQPAYTLNSSTAGLPVRIAKP
ncbi:MAG: hypothetical protein JRE20_04550 [Deltaproteobacteria bacterium]|nr:hypothetical protein [Deltaproteobacteria bacterium]